MNKKLFLFTIYVLHTFHKENDTTPMRIILHTIFFLVFFHLSAFSQTFGLKWRIEDTSINRPLNRDTVLVLNKNEDELRIYFPKDTLNRAFCYQLSQVNSHVFCDTVSMVSYSNLRGGDYVFTVWQEGKQGESNKKTLKIKKIRDVMEEEWFFPSVAFYILLLVSAIIYFWTIYNFRQRIKVENMRNQIASDLHDEVGATLSSIGIFAQTLQKRMNKGTPENLPIVEKIMASSDETITNLRDTVWAINPSNDDMPKLLEKMRAFAYQILTAKEIPLQFENGFETMLSMKISMEQRRNVYLMFKETIHNIVKHANASQVIIEAKREKDCVRLTIQDNGKGFDCDLLRGVSDGNGLKNLERRANECFIKLKIESKIGEGTTVSMLIPEI